MHKVPSRVEQLNLVFLTKPTIDKTWPRKLMLRADLVQPAHSRKEKNMYLVKPSSEYEAQTPSRVRFPLRAV